MFVFISYVRENEQQVQRLCDELTRHGVEVWLDRTKIKPGQNWRVAIEKAIDKGDFFLACFSKEYSQKNKCVMNEEITLAIKQLRERGDDTTWFIPVLLSGEVPQRRIDDSRKLTDIQWVELNEANWDRGIQQIFQTIQPPRHLRSEATDNLNEEAVWSMLQGQGFFCNRLNRDGPGLLHQYGETGRHGQLVIDDSTGLTWEQSSSPESMTFENAQKYIQDLKEYAGFNDWRLPTLDEAMSLMEPKKNEHGLHIDRIFDKKQRWIWVADKESVSRAWFVSFSNGYCLEESDDQLNFVRAVR